MAAIIASSNNQKISGQVQRTPEGCNCRQNPCPLSGTCDTKDVVYSAKLVNDKGEISVYKGITSRKFIERYRLHKSSFKNRG